MIVVSLTGGLGNQMFQYAHGRKIAIGSNTVLKLNIGDLLSDPTHKRNFQLSVFNIQASIASKVDILKIKYCHLGVYLDGCWQGEKYFWGIEDIIRKDFTFINKPIGNNLSSIKKISQTQSVAVHIRHGDYLVKTHKYVILDKDYYHKAMEYVKSRVKNAVFFVFTETVEDRNWAKANLENQGAIVFMDNNKSENGFEDMRLMAACKHNIIANSTFSWWAAWLNNYPEKIVIAPKKWFRDSSETKDLLPSQWIKI